MPRATRPAAKKASPKKAAAGSSRGARVVRNAAKKGTARTAKKVVPARKAMPAGKRVAANRTVAAKRTSATKKSTAKKATKKVVPARKAMPAVKGVPAKKATKRSSPVDNKFLQEMRLLLQSERAAYSRQAEALKAEADQLAEEMEPGDIQFDEESGEGGTMNVERERDLALSAQAQTAIEEIDRALEKIKTGTYGICEQCGQPIPRARLKALPYAALCVACKSGGLSRR